MGRSLATPGGERLLCLAISCVIIVRYWDSHAHITTKVRNVNMKSTVNVEIGQRLWQERKRLGLTQSEMAKLGDVGFSTYCTYENGDRSPKAESLQLWAGHGMDVRFVVMGEITDSDKNLTPDEKRMLMGWRDSPEELRSAWVGFYQAYRVAVYGEDIQHDG